MEKSGCLGKCSMAPNIVLMPGKKRLSGMKPEAIAELLTSLKLND
jgi:NADH:ubiquinone oxidoreductase subunit E